MSLIAIVTRRFRSAIYLLREALRRPGPHGLFSWRFLLPTRDPRIAMHRRATWAMRGPWPAPAWAIIQAKLAWRWRRVHAPQEADRAVSYFGEAVQAREGILVSEQRRTILELAQRWCISPVEAYEKRLYAAPDRALDYIHASETMGLHRVLNGGWPPPPDAKILHDKAAFVQRAAAVGLPVVPTVMLLPRGKPAHAIELLDRKMGNVQNGVFFKTRSGFMGMGAFGVQLIKRADQHEKKTVEGLMLTGHPLTGIREVQSSLDTLLAEDDVLVQPWLRAHKMFANMVTAGHSPVVRITTQRIRQMAAPQTDKILAAFLRVPIRVAIPNGLFRTHQVVFRIDVQTGLIMTTPDSILSLRPETKSLEDEVFDRLISGTAEPPTIPFWDEICTTTLTAQKAFQNLWAIGWDWIVTADGPILLEGNVHWDTKYAQEVAGPLLWAALAVTPGFSSKSS